MIELDQYGTPIKVFEGIGVVEFESGSRADIAFDARQLEDGSIVVGCMAKGGTALQRDAKRIIGYTTDYDEIEINGQRANLLSGGSGYLAKMHYSFTRLRLMHTPNRWPVDRVTGALANFIFDPFGLMIVPDPMQVAFRGYNLEIVPVENYIRVWERLQGIGGVLQTAKVIVGRVDGQTFNEDEIADLLFDLCNPLSLARSTRVTWVSYEAVSIANSGQTIPQFTQYTSSISRSYTTIGLTQRLLSDIAELVSAWGAHGGTNSISRDDLSARIAHFLDTCARGTFAETLGLTAASLLDAVANQYATITGFKGAFRQRLEHLVGDLNISCAFLPEVIKTRNNLAHEGAFATADTAKEDRQLRWLAYAILVRLVDINMVVPSYGP